MMEYTVRYGLEFNPFAKNSKEILFESKEFKEVQFRLDYLSKTMGFGILTGEPGRGKTTAVRNWTSKLNPSLFKVVYTSLSTLSVGDFYRNMAAELGAEPASRKPENFRRIQAEINRLALEKRKTPVIIIDEADHVPGDVLSDLKMLFNFEMDSKDRAVILMIGLPRLNTTLNQSAHEAIRQRLVMNYNMDPLSKEEARAYIEEKLRGAGCTQAVFDEEAIEAILNSADGSPRLISKLCTQSMIMANIKELSTVNADAAMNAISDCELI